MKSAEILLILRTLANGNYRVTLHAKQRMSERNITHADVRHCGLDAVAFRQSDGKFKVVGRDLDSERLTLICVFEDGVLIISAF